MFFYLSTMLTDNRNYFHLENIEKHSKLTVFKIVRPDLNLRFAVFFCSFCCFFMISKTFILFQTKTSLKILYYFSKSNTVKFFSCNFNIAFFVNFNGWLLLRIFYVAFFRILEPLNNHEINSPLEFSLDNQFQINLALLNVSQKEIPF